MECCWTTRSTKTHGSQRTKKHVKTMGNATNKRDANRGVSECICAVFVLTGRTCCGSISLQDVKAASVEPAGTYAPGPHTAWTHSVQPSPMKIGDRRIPPRRASKARMLHPSSTVVFFSIVIRSKSPMMAFGLTYELFPIEAPIMRMYQVNNHGERSKMPRPAILVTCSTKNHRK